MFRDSAAFMNFSHDFNDEDRCIQALFESRWPNGFECPYCKHTQANLISSRRLPLYDCKSCHKQTSLIVGTIMEGSRTPIQKWFQAIYLLASPGSINASQLSIIIGVTYKTAWLICHKIRHAMSFTESRKILSGIVRVSDGIYCRRLTPYFDWHKQEQSLLLASSENEEGKITHLKIALMPKRKQTDKYIGADPTRFLNEHIDPQIASKIMITPRYGKNSNQSLTWRSLHVTNWLAWMFRGIGPKHLQAYLDHYCYHMNNQNHIESHFHRLLNDCAATATITYKKLVNSFATRRSSRRFRELIPVTQSVC